jgi:hypothetical protein
VETLAISNSEREELLRIATSRKLTEDQLVAEIIRAFLASQ